MIEKDLISEYVERVFELYRLNKFEFFYDIDDESDFIDRFVTPLFVEGFESEEETVLRVSQFLGLTPEEIISRDKLAALKYWDKFPYFALHNDFVATWIWNSENRNAVPSAEDTFLWALFDTPLGEARYDYVSIRKRFHDQLKEAAKFDPAYYPEFSRLHVLKTDTREMFSFPKCGEMIRSYLDMVYRAQDLFFRATKEDLPEEEQREYNFLVSYLVIDDIVRPSTPLYYQEVVRLRNVFQEEGYKEFWSYAKIRNSIVGQEPWRCVEFFDNKDLVQEVVNAFPSAKKEMIEFSRLVKNFRIDFQWEKTKLQVEKSKKSVEAVLADGDHDETSNQNPVLQIYVEKTAEEIADFKDGLKKLRTVASPPSMGGVRLPDRELTLDGLLSVNRISRRICGGN